MDGRALHPATVRDYFKFAALQIRRELTEMARHHYGRQGHAAHHVTDPGKVDTSGVDLLVGLDARPDGTVDLFSRLAVGLRRWRPPRRPASTGAACRAASARCRPC